MADPRLSRYSHFRQQQSPTQREEPEGLLALSIAKSNGNGIGYADEEDDAFQFESDSDSEDERQQQHIIEEIGRRHAAPSKRRISSVKQQQQLQQQKTHQVPLETDLDSGEMVRPAKSVGDLMDSPRKQTHDSSFQKGVSEYDRSKSVNFDKDESPNTSLNKQKSQHDMRVDKSLERINVPDWFRSGDDEEDQLVFRLRSVHDDDDYHDDDMRKMRQSAFQRTKSAPPSRKTSSSNVVSAIETYRQSRQWTLSRAVESRASTTASGASNFTRPSVRYSEKEASLRRPKPIAIRPLESLLSTPTKENQKPVPESKQKVQMSSERVITEQHIQTSTYHFKKSTENLNSVSPTRKSNEKLVVEKPMRTPSPIVEIPVERHYRRIVSPPGPATLPKPKSPEPLVEMEQEMRVRSPRGVFSPSGNGPRPVLLAGYTEAEYIDDGPQQLVVEPTPVAPTPERHVPQTTTVQHIYESPMPTVQTKMPVEPTPFVFNNKPMRIINRNSRETDIDAPDSPVSEVLEQSIKSSTDGFQPGRVDVVITPQENCDISPHPMSIHVESLKKSPSPIPVTISSGSSIPIQEKQKSPVHSWRTDTVFTDHHQNEESVVDTKCEIVSTHRSSRGETRISPVETAVVEEQEQQTTITTTRSTSSSIRASFRKPGKFIAKLWKDKPSSEKPVVEEELLKDEVPEENPPPPLPPPCYSENTNLPLHETNRRSEDSLVENEEPKPSLDTNAPSNPPRHFRASFRNLFSKDRNSKNKEKKEKERRDRSMDATTAKLKETSIDNGDISKSSHNIMSTSAIETPVDSSINESMTISEMSQSVMIETKKQKKPNVFSPARWISSRSPASKPANEDNNSSRVESVIGVETKEESPVTVNRQNGTSSKMRNWLPRDNSSNFKPINIPEMEEKMPQRQEDLQSPAYQSVTLGKSPKSDSKKPKTPQHHLSQSSIGNFSNGRGSSINGESRDPDAVSTTSSKKKKSIFNAIMRYQEEHDHRYVQRYAPVSGEQVSWLNKRNVNELVQSNVSRPSQSTTPGPGSPTSVRSRPIASDAFSLSSNVHAQQKKPDFSNLSSSYHAGMSNSQHSLARERARTPHQHQAQQQQQPPNGTYSRTVSQASQSSMYQAQRTHQQQIQRHHHPHPPAPQVQAPPPPPQIPVAPARPMVDMYPPVTCQRKGCNHTVNAEIARTQFKVCSSCGNAFCSKQCKDLHMIKKRCPLDAVRELCQRAAKRLENDRMLVALLSQFARMSYLCHGRGYVYAHFSGPERAGAFCVGQVGLHSLALEFHTTAHTEAALMRGEPLEEVMDLLQTYNPDAKLVLCVGVSVNDERSAFSRDGRPLNNRSWDTAAVEDLNSSSGESRVVLRAAKLRLAIPRPGSLRALMLVSAGVAFQNRRGNVKKIKEITFQNIQQHLKKRGVDLLTSHPNVYTRLTQYVSGTQEFPPTGICVWDDSVGRSMLALLFPDALPRQDWLRQLHQLGDVELGLPDPRQMAVGVDV